MELADKDFKTARNIWKNLKANMNIKKINKNYNRELIWVVRSEYNNRS